MIWGQAYRAYIAMCIAKKEVPLDWDAWVTTQKEGADE